MTGQTCWVVSDGRPGNENQCLGLAEAIGLPITIKRVHPRAPWRWLPPPLCVGALHSLGPESDRLSPPWPNLLIAAGRQSVALSAAIRRAAGGATFTVQIFKPGLALERFDLVVAPQHDQLSGPNVISTRGSLNRITQERLEAEAEKIRGRLAHLPRPLVAVLIGGSNDCYHFDETVAADLAGRLAALCRNSGASLAITTSRRTGEDNERILRQTLAGLPVEFWDGSGDNPYFGYLGLADAIVVSGDSVNMVSEACATGKPVHVIELPGGNDKFNRFHATLRQDGLTRPFSGQLEQWAYPPLDDTAVVAAEVKRRMAAQRGRHQN
jgi:mitochondrial fission protein ELM1